MEIEPGIERTILIPLHDQDRDIPAQGYYGTSVFLVNTVYADRGTKNLIQHYGFETASDTIGSWYERRSTDNGRTWNEPRLLLEPEETPEGVIRWGESCLFQDQRTGAILHIMNRSLYPGVRFTGDVSRLTRIFYRLSTDEGHHFSEPQQLIEEGFDEKHWSEDVVYGENSMAVSFCSPTTLSDGTILLPTQLVPQGSDFDRPFLIALEAGCLRGTWKADELVWHAGGRVRIDPALSSRGLCEPTIAELADGNLLMICRGSNSGMAKVPGRKWYALSADGGLSWSKPDVLCMDTGKPFFSPATGSRLIRHHRNGILYWIGNILSENPDGNRPRYPLQIAEVDEKKRCLRKETIRVIETRRQGDSPMVQFSNFRVYEDRETGDFLLTLARIQANSEHDLSSPAYQYRIRL